MGWGVMHQRVRAGMSSSVRACARRCVHVLVVRACSRASLVSTAAHTAVVFIVPRDLVSLPQYQLRSQCDGAQLERISGAGWRVQTFSWRRQCH